MDRDYVLRTTYYGTRECGWNGAWRKHRYGNQLKIEPYAAAWRVEKRTFGIDGSAQVPEISLKDPCPAARCCRGAYLVPAWLFSATQSAVCNLQSVACSLQPDAKGCVPVCLCACVPVSPTIRLRSPAPAGTMTIVSSRPNPYAFTLSTFRSMLGSDRVGE